MDEEKKTGPSGLLVTTGALLGATAGAVAIADASGPTIVKALLIMAFAAVALVAYRARGQFAATFVRPGDRKRSRIGLAAIGIGIAAILLVAIRAADLPSAPDDPAAAAQAATGQPDVSPDLANMSMEGGPMDPNRGKFGIPSKGDGSSLATYHRRANPRSVLDRPIDEAGANAWFARNEPLPILRNYCRIDPYAGALAMQIIPSGDRILVHSQGSKDSVLGRAQTYEPALAKVDAEAVRTRSAPKASCSGKSCSMDLSDGSRLAIRWNETPQEIVVKDGDNPDSDWSDCRCQYSGSFILCEGVQEYGKFAQ